MNRFDARVLSIVGLALLVAVAGTAAAQPTPGPGPWSSGHPLWFDLDGNGQPGTGELTGYPEYDGEGCTNVVGYPAVIGSSQSPCATVMMSVGIFGSITRPNGTIQSLSSNATGTVFTFTETDFQPPALKAQSAGRVAALAPANGTGTLLDLNSDGIYDSLEVVGTNGAATVPQTRISLVPQDVTGDGRPDYITLPWTTSGAGMLGVVTDATPRIYIPLTDTNADGWPDTITIQVANSNMATTAGPPLSGPALAAANGAPVPSASTAGLFLFAAAVIALGVKLLRGPIVTP